MRLLVVGPPDVEAARTLDGVTSKPALRVSASTGRSRRSVGRCFIRKHLLSVQGKTYNLLSRRHLGGPTNHQHGVLKISVTGVQVSWHPPKGGKRGWVFLARSVRLGRRAQPLT